MREIHQVTSVSHLEDLPRLLIAFCKNPVETMKTPMRLSWPALLSIQIGAAMVSGALAGIFANSFLDFMLGLLIFPLSSVVIGFAFSGLVYGFFSFFRMTYLDYQRLHSIVVVALVPYFFFHIFAGFVPPMNLIGFALTSVLIIVGLVEQFDLDRKTVMSLIGILAGIFFIAWIIAQISVTDNELQAQAGERRFPSSIEESSVSEPPARQEDDPNLLPQSEPEASY